MGYQDILNAQAGYRNAWLTRRQVFQNGASKTSGQATIFNGDQLFIGITEFIEQIGIQGFGKPEIKMTEGLRGIGLGDGPGHLLPQGSITQNRYTAPPLQPAGFPDGDQLKRLFPIRILAVSLGYRMAIGPREALWAV